MTLNNFKFKEPPEALNVESFIAWIKTFIVQFIAKRVLELQCRQRSSEPIEMSLLAVDRIVFRIPPWESFKPIIHDVVRRIPSPVIPCKKLADVIQIIEKEIDNFKNFKDVDHEAQKAVSMFRKSSSREKPKLFTVGSHCEMLLAVLIIFKHMLADLGLDDPELIRMCEVRSYIYYSNLNIHGSCAYRDCMATLLPYRNYAAPFVTILWKRYGGIRTNFPSVDTIPQCLRWYYRRFFPWNVWVKPCWRRSSPR